MPGQPQLQTWWQMALTTKCHPAHLLLDNQALHPGAHFPGAPGCKSKLLCTMHIPNLKAAKCWAQLGRWASTKCKVQPDNNALEHQVAARLLIPHLVPVQTSLHPGHQEVQSRANLLCPAPPLPPCTKTPPTQIRLYAPFPLPGCMKNREAGSWRTTSII